jgi:hypothetical protein
LWRATPRLIISFRNLVRVTMNAVDELQQLITQRGSSGRRPSSRLILEIDIRERLSAVVAHDEAGGLLLDRQGGGKRRLGMAT